MSKVADRLNTIDTMFTEAAQKGLLQLTAENEILNGRIIHLEGRPLINFGFLLVRGDREKLNALRASEEFLRLNIRASLVVDNLGVINAFIGEELQRVFTNLGAQASELSQASGTRGTPAV